MLFKFNFLEIWVFWNWVFMFQFIVNKKKRIGWIPIISSDIKRRSCLMRINLYFKLFNPWKTPESFLFIFLRFSSFLKVSFDLLLQFIFYYYRLLNCLLSIEGDKNIVINFYMHQWHITHLFFMSPKIFLLLSLWGIN